MSKNKYVLAVFCILCCFVIRWIPMVHAEEGIVVSDWQGLLEALEAKNSRIGISKSIVAMTSISIDFDVEIYGMTQGIVLSDARIFAYGNVTLRNLSLQCDSTGKLTRESAVVGAWDGKLTLDQVVILSQERKTSGNALAAVFVASPASLFLDHATLCGSDVAQGFGGYAGHALTAKGDVEAIDSNFFAGKSDYFAGHGVVASGDGKREFLRCEIKGGTGDESGVAFLVNTTKDISLTLTDCKASGAPAISADGKVSISLANTYIVSPGVPFLTTAGAKLNFVSAGNLVDYPETESLCAGEAKIQGLATDLTLPESLAIKEGDKSQLLLTLLPETAMYGQVDWSSSDPTIATVTSSGSVTALAQGETDITASLRQGSEKHILVSVSSKPSTTLPDENTLPDLGIAKPDILASQPIWDIPGQDTIYTHEEIGKRTVFSLSLVGKRGAALYKERDTSTKPLSTLAAGELLCVQPYNDTWSVVKQGEEKVFVLVDDLLLQQWNVEDGGYFAFLREGSNWYTSPTGQSMGEIPSGTLVRAIFSCDRWTAIVWQQKVVYALSESLYLHVMHETTATVQTDQAYAPVYQEAIESSGIVCFVGNGVNLTVDNSDLPLEQKDFVRVKVGRSIGYIAANALAR